MKKFQDLFKPQTITEDKQGADGQKAPPPMLVFKRQAIRLLPNNQRVVTYFNQDHSLTVAIPYQGNFINKGVASVVKEAVEKPSKKKIKPEGDEEEMDEHLAMLHKAVQNKRLTKITFKDGSAMMVDGPTATEILNVHGAVNDENKKKMLKHIRKSKHTFLNIMNFAKGVHAKLPGDKKGKK